MKYLISAVLLLLTGCTEEDVSWKLAMQGSWVTTSQNASMQDPQTSGLVYWRDRLLSLSDRSAVEQYRLKLHHLDPASGRLLDSYHQLVFAPAVQKGCFGDYVTDNPDLEALVIDPDNDSVLYIATEDASMKDLSESCQIFAQSHSTDYPSLLLRVELTDTNTAMVTHVRPLRFDRGDNIGDYPNDGFEGLAMGPDRTLYLAREKDAQRKPRIFTLTIDDKFWQQPGFADLVDANLALPDLGDGNHPINGMAFYRDRQSDTDYLVAAARNDDQLWLVPTKGSQELKIVDISFWAPASGPGCEPWELMDNASLEGVAVNGSQLWVINDPWKSHYEENIICDSNAQRYEDMSPLLFASDMQTLFDQAEEQAQKRQKPQ